MRGEKYFRTNSWVTRASLAEHTFRKRFGFAAMFVLFLAGLPASHPLAREQRFRLHVRHTTRIVCQRYFCVAKRSPCVRTAAAVVRRLLRGLWPQSTDGLLFQESRMATAIYNVWMTFIRTARKLVRHCLVINGNYEVCCWLNVYIHLMKYNVTLQF